MAIRVLRSALAIVLLAGSATASAFTIEEDAKAFGTMPAIWGPDLSPSGRFVSFLTMHASDVPVNVVFDLEEKKVTSPIASESGVLDLSWCGWKSDERLVCGFHGVDEQWNTRMALTRLMAVDRDGSDMRNLMLQARQLQGTVIDWLTDDPNRILVPYADADQNSMLLGDLGVAALDIRTTRTDWVKRPRGGYSLWMADGTGELRLRLHDEPSKWVWEATAVESAKWFPIGEVSKTDYRGQTGSPEGFLEDRNELVWNQRKDGRDALYVLDLSGKKEPRLLFAHDEVDVGGLISIGKERRAVGVRYHTDRQHAAYFDQRILEVAARAQKTFAGMTVNVYSESWDRRYYIVSTHSDTDAGAFYRLDSENGHLLKIRARHPQLDGREFGKMKAFKYATADGARVPAYVTLPPGKLAKPLPTIVLPHGGPESRDRWGWNWLSQFLAARGYLVVQANYRGSGGYGLEWAGNGGFQEWTQAMSDIEDGIAKLVEKGVADPARVCIVGWSYGGYAALMSAIEYPSRYQCAVSIAPVTDLDQLVEDSRKFVNRRIRRDQVGDDRAVRKAGSPLQRVDEIPVPVLLFHGKNDVNVYVEHSERLAKAMKKAKKPVELVTYEDTEHSLDRNTARIDMLTRIGHFLDEHLAAPAAE